MLLSNDYCKHIFVDASFGYSIMSCVGEISIPLSRVLRHSRTFTAT